MIPIQREIVVTAPIVAGLMFHSFIKIGVTSWVMVDSYTSNPQPSMHTARTVALSRVQRSADAPGRLELASVAPIPASNVWGSQGILSWARAGNKAFCRGLRPHPLV